MSDALGPGVFQSFINYLFSSGDISVPDDFHERCNKITEMLDNDISGTINSILDYSVNSASEANYRVECSEPTLEKLLNAWLDKINLDIKGIPTGLQALSKEYFKERWEGSSFCILRVSDWEKITIDNVTIDIPTTMWFVNGGSIYVVRPKSKNVKLGSDEFYLDSEHKISIPSGKDEEIIVQKPFNRWFDEYSTPYLIRKGVYKNWLGMKVLQDKSDEVISKILPYLFLITKGTENLFLQGDVNYSDDELKELTENFKSEVQKYRNEKGKTPTNTIPFDTKYEHLIPDLKKILAEELYRQGYRSILAGLGFIDMLEISPSRQESRMNPKAFVSEINEGVSGFKSMLLEVIYLIIDRNKSHSKIFSKKGKIIIVNSPLRINVEQILDSLRSSFVYGVTSIQSYQEILGLDPETEKERRQKERDEGLEELFYPHIVTNIEEKGIDTISVPKPKTKKQEEKEKEKEAKPDHMQEAELQDFIMAPYTMDNYPDYLKKYPKDAIEVWVKTFNEVLKNSGDESKAFPIAWNSMKRFLKKNYIKQPDGTYKKKE